MNTETDYLKSIADEIANGKSLDKAKPNHNLLVESKRLEKDIIYGLNAIGNFTQRDTFHFNTLSKLVNICDILYEATGTVNPDTMVLIDLLAAVEQILPNEIRPNLKLPKAFIALQKEGLDATWIKHKTIMQEQGVNEKLIDIAGIPFKRFTDAKETLNRGDFNWLKGYVTKLNILDWADADCNSTAEALMSLLIGRDFNDDRFFIYCKKYIRERADSVTGKWQRLLEYANCEKLVLQDTQINMPLFDVDANSVSVRLIKWIGEEIDFVETHERENPYLKLRFNMYVNRIAFFFKLLHEQKLFGDASFKELAQQIASTCSSADGEEILATTIISKAYPKDEKMMEEMEGLLVKMLAYVRSFMRKK